MIQLATVVESFIPPWFLCHPLVVLSFKLDDIQLLDFCYVFWIFRMLTTLPFWFSYGLLFFVRWFMIEFKWLICRVHYLSLDPLPLKSNYFFLKRWYNCEYLCIPFLFNSSLPNLLSASVTDPSYKCGRNCARVWTRALDLEMQRSQQVVLTAHNRFW